MIRTRSVQRLGALVIIAMVLQPELVFGCATCFGQSDSALARGMNMGIVTLLGVLATVLASVAGFFVFLARQSRRVGAANGEPAELRDTDTRS